MDGRELAMLNAVSRGVTNPCSQDFPDSSVLEKYMNCTERTPVSLYLTLLKQALTFTLWPEPAVPLLAHNDNRSPTKRILISFLARLLGIWGIQLVRERHATDDERAEGRIWPGNADTMIGLRRLDNLQDCIECLLRENIAGDFIETGVWRGGACIFMKGVLAAYGDTCRKIYVADSFEGLPPPDSTKWPADEGDLHFTQKPLVVSQEEVEARFSRYGLLDNNVIFLKGFFEKTLPSAPIERLALLRLDGDMYGSTMEALANLYPKLARGGFCIVDDYALKGCRSAVDDYRASQRITSPLFSVDWTGRFWRKTD